MNKQILVAVGLTLAGLMFIPSVSIATLTDPSATGPDIVVTGIETSKEDIADFIKTTIATPKGGRHEGQFARFTQAVCPKVVGLSLENSEQIEQRMRGIAKAADMRVAAKSCTPNVYVMVVSDGNEAISMLRKKRSRLFGDMPHHARERIAKSGGPTYSWKRIQTGSAETGALQNSDETRKLGRVTEVPIMNSNVKSRVKRTITKNITHSFLLIEKDALVDLTTVQIADYAAMRSYIETADQTARTAPRYSILALFDRPKKDEKTPSSASEMDLVLLSSLYNSSADVSASMQSSAMVHRIEKELTARDEQ